MSKRRLAAIMFTDVVGYTAMMEKDEHAAMEVLSAHRKDLEELSGEFNAEVVEYFGDGSLTIFDSVHDAVGCALELQRRLTRDGIVPLRIGVHIGEVLQQDGKVFGDGVNVASRVESTGYAGTVLLSQQAHDKVKNQPEFQFQDLGEFSFKNVDRPMRVYGLVDEGLPQIELKKLNFGKASPISRTRTWYLAALTLLVIAAIASGVTYWLTIYDVQVPGQETSEDLLRMAVFPFEVKGSDEIAYLEEGLVDVFSTKIDGVAGFSAVDPNMTIGYYRKQSGSLVTPLDFAGAARELGANQFILGNVITLGEDIRLKVSYYNAEGKLETSEEVLIRNANELLGGVDDLVRQTVATRLSNAGQDVVAAQAMFSSDIEALRLYLEGEEKKRLGRHEEASRFFMNALDRDSSMALTWLSLWQVCSWSFQCDLADELILTNARKFSSDLPEKYKDYIDAVTDWRFYSGGDMESRVKNLIGRYGESTELLTLLGEVIFHSHIVKERPATEALPYFIKAYEYDPGNGEVLNHAIQLLSYRRDAETLSELLKTIPDKSVHWTIAKAAYLICRDDEWSDEEVRQIVTHPAFNIDQVFLLSRSDRTLGRMGRLFDDLERLNGSRFIEDEAPIHYLKTMWFGKRAEAEKQLLGQAFRLMIGYGRPLAYLGIDFEAKGQMLLDARSNLSSGNVAGPWPDDFLLALISAYENNEEDYRASMKMLGELSGADNIYSHEILLAQGYWLHTQGDYIQSNEILDSAMTTYGRAVDGLVHAFTEGAITLVQAENYYSLGQKAKSLLYYNILTDVLNAGDDEKMGYSWLRRGEICSELGRDEEALQFFNYFLDMYAECDPEFEPWIERAEAGRQEVFSRLN